jgi:hypothetical protein
VAGTWSLLLLFAAIKGAERQTQLVTDIPQEGFLFVLATYMNSVQQS